MFMRQQNNNMLSHLFVLFNFCKCPWSVIAISTDKLATYIKHTPKQTNEYKSTMQCCDNPPAIRPGPLAGAC